MIADILGILTGEREGKQNGSLELVDQLMEIIINIRQQARRNKDWSTADTIRDQLGTIGVVLEDSAQGVRWRRR